MFLNKKIYFSSGRRGINPPSFRRREHPKWLLLLRKVSVKHYTPMFLTQMITRDRQQTERTPVDDFEPKGLNILKAIQDMWGIMESHYCNSVESSTFPLNAAFGRHQRWHPSSFRRCCSSNCSACFEPFTIILRGTMKSITKVLWNNSNTEFRTPVQVYL